MKALPIEKRELGDLLKNFQKALKVYSIADLNEAILQALNDSDIGKSVQISATLEVICHHFNIERKSLVKSRYVRGNSMAKDLAYQILHLTFDLPVRYIAKRVFFYKGHAAVMSSIVSFKKLNLNLKQDREHKELYDQLQAKAIQLVANKKLNLS